MNNYLKHWIWNKEDTMNLLNLNTKDRESKLYELENTRIYKLRSGKGENTCRNAFILYTGDLTYTLYWDWVPFLLLENERITVLNEQWWGQFNKTEKNYINRFFIQTHGVPCDGKALNLIRNGSIKNVQKLIEIYESEGGTYEEL